MRKHKVLGVNSSQAHTHTHKSVVAEHLTRRPRLWVRFLAPPTLTMSTAVMTVGEVLGFLSESFLDSFLLPK